MSTYDHEKILTDWSNGTLTADMAIEHSLQHIAELYNRQKALQNKVNHLENKVTTLQSEIDRLVKGCRQELEHEQRKINGMKKATAHNSNSVEVAASPKK